MRLRYAIYWIGFRLTYRRPLKPLGFRMYRYIHNNVDKIAQTMAERAANQGRLNEEA